MQQGYTGYYKSYYKAAKKVTTAGSSIRLFRLKFRNRATVVVFGCWLSVFQGLKFRV